jgi:UDP:flavonoid glycosyltransferase YjiC (YdhE family)
MEEAGVVLCPLEQGIPYEPFDRVPVADQDAAFMKVFFDDGYSADLRREITRRRPDALVIDSYLFAAMAAAEASGIPFAVLVHTVFGWMGFLGELLLSMINEGRVTAGLPEASSTGIWSAAQRILVASTPLLDAPAPAELPHMRHVGPIFNGGLESADNYAGDGDSRPLVLVGFSTTYMQQEGPLQRIVDALGEMPLRAIVTIGPETDITSVVGTANVDVVPSVPHAAVMPHASAVITHGGHGTVSMALAYGKPLVCLPLGRDQTHIAGLVQEIGAGIALAPDSSPVTIARATRALLNGGTYSVKAEEIADAIRMAGNGAENAATEIEAIA